jgi:nitrate/nitrite transport system substrate-binding protein
MKRRDFLKLMLGTATVPLVAACAQAPAASPTGAPGAGGATAPAAPTGGATVNLGVIATTDMAPVVMADRLGLYKKHGLENVVVTKEANWAAVRDKLLSGELHGAMCHFGIPFAVATGEGGADKQIRVSMMLNNNGQGLTLRKELAPTVGYGKTDGVKAAVEQLAAANTSRPPTFAMAFPGVSHDLCLRSWIAAAGVDPKTVQVVTTPPAQMIARMKAGEIDGFYVGEPWHEVAVNEDIGFTHYASQDVWQDHPEKALALNANFADTRRAEAKSVTSAVLEASQWLDVGDNRVSAANVISEAAFMNVAPDLILPRFRVEATYNLGGGLGEKTFAPETALIFYKSGAVSYPRIAHGIWFMAQYVRFGMIPQAPDYKAVAEQLIMQDLYTEVAKELNVAIPADDMQPFALQLDGIEFDPNDVAASLERYK